MAFDTIEQTRATGAPITLYKFTIGAATPYTFTDHNETVAYDDGGGSENYLPIAIRMEEVKVAGTLDKTELRITTAQDSGLAELYLVYPPPEPVGVVVRTGHAQDTEFKLAYTGTVLDCSREDNEAIFATEPASSALQRPGLRRHYQYTCPLVLFEGDCTASKATATTSHSVVSVQATSIDLASGWEGANELADYRGGTIEWTNTDGNTEVRKIISPGTTRIEVSGPIRDLAALDSVDVILGCNRLEDHCQNLHNVINAFGGHTFIPDKNPWIKNFFY